MKLQRGLFVALSFILLVLMIPFVLGEVFINEFLPNSVDTNYEWIELFNNGTLSVNLSNFNISDTSPNSNFTLPDISIASNEFIILAKDEVTFNQTYNLTNVQIVDYGTFDLNNGGDSIFLYNSSGTLIDSILNYVDPGENVSIGRYPDGSSIIVDLLTQTPGFQNDNAPPIFPISSINNTSPKTGEVIGLAQNVTDITNNVSMVIFFHNQTGEFNNISNTSIINIKSINYTPNITVTLVRGDVIGYGYWANDTTGQINISAVNTVTVANTNPTQANIVNVTNKYYTNNITINITPSTDADSDTLTYFWFRNTTSSPTPVLLVSGTTATNLTTTITDGDGTYWYFVNVSDGDINITGDMWNFTLDTTVPVVNATLNESLTNIGFGDVINLTVNATDNIGLSFGQIIVNDTGSVRFFNFSLSGTEAKFSQNITISCFGGCVINFTARVNDTVGNFRTNDTIITVIDDIKPEINASIFNVSSPRRNDVVNFTANVSDEVGLSFCQFFMNGTSDGSFIILNKTVTGTNDQCSQNWTIDLVRGNVINFSVLVNDTSNNINQSEQIITVADFVAIVSIGINDTAPKINEIVNVSSNVTDQDDLSFCLIKHNGTAGGAFTNTTFALSGTTGFCSDPISIDLVKGNVINFTIEINDSVGGIIYRNSTKVTVANTPPTQANIVNTTNQLYNSNITINITPSTDADSDTLTYFWFRNTSSDSYPNLVQSGATSTSYTTNETSDGTYWYFVNVSDGDVNVTGNMWNFTLDATVPVVNSTLNKSLTNIIFGDVINLTANATDNVGLSFGQIIVNDTGGVRFFNFSLSGTEAKFSQNITISCFGGCVINFTARVNDTAGNFRTNDTIITVAATPDTTPPIVNATLNRSLTNIRRNDVINITVNATDVGGGLDTCQFFFNGTSDGHFIILNKSLTGTDDQCSQNWTVSLAKGSVINFSVVVNDTSTNVAGGNLALNDIIITVADFVATVSIGINNTSPKINEIVNVSSIVADSDGLSFCVIKNNQTGPFVSSTFGLSGTNDVCSDAVPITVGGGNVINFTIEVNDTAGDIIYQNSALITVANTPLIFTGSIQNVTWSEDTIDSSIDLSAFFIDVDGDTLTFNSTSPSNILVSINQVSGIVTLTPDTNFNGTNFISFSASDGINTTLSNQVILNVTNVNDAPTITSFFPLDNTTIAADVGSQEFNVTFTDIDVGDIATASWFIDGTFLVNSSNVTVSGLSDGIYNITVIVTDILSVSARNEWLLNVTSEIIGDGITSNVLNLNETERQNATNIAINHTTFGGIDFGNETLDFSGVVNLEDAFNISRGLISVDTDTYPGLNGSASLVMKGLNFTKAPWINISSGFESIAGGSSCPISICTNITYDVTNGILRFNVAHFTTFFTQQNTTNGAPVITSTPLTGATESSIYSYDVDAADPDGDVLIFSLLVKPSGMSISPSSGLITWVPSFTQLGTNNVTVSVSDGNLTDSQIFQINVTKGARLVITDLDIKIDGKSDKNVQNNTRISKEVKPGSNIEFKIEIKNTFTQAENLEIEDIEVQIIIEDIDDDDDLEEESKEFDLDWGDDKTIKIDFNIPLEIDEDTFDVIIDVKGEDDNGTEHKIKWILELEVDKDKHDISIRRLNLNPTSVSCTRIVTLSTQIINLGRDEEDEVVLEISSSELGISFRQEDIELEEGTNDNTYDKLLNIRVPNDQDAGTYPITVNAYYNNDRLDDTETIELNVQNCERFKEEKEFVQEDTDIVEVIRPPIVEQKKPPVMDITFRGSNSYFLLLTISFVLLSGLTIFLAGAAMIKFKK